MLEQRNRRMKMMAGKGLTSKEGWQRLARSVDTVEDVLKHGMELLNMKEDDPYAMKHTPLEKEIIKWRAVLRESKMLQSTNRFVTIFRWVDFGVLS